MPCFNAYTEISYLEMQTTGSSQDVIRLGVGVGRVGWFDWFDPAE